MTTTTAAAHIITSTATALGDPAIIIMTRDEGMGADEIVKYGLPENVLLGGACDRLSLKHGWTMVGEPAEIDRGYYIVDVERV